MPVPTSISDLSNIASMNSPAGTESVKGTIDDYLRSHAAFIRQLADVVAGPTVTLASASTVAIGFAASGNVAITGTTTINAFDNAAEGTMRWVVFGGSLTLTHNAISLILPGGANTVTVAGDAALFKSLGTGNWKCMGYLRNSVLFPATGTLLSDASIIPVAKGGTGATAAAVALSNLGGLPYTGGSLTGALTLNNGVPLSMRDASGTGRAFAYVDAANYTNIYNAGGNGYRFWNQAATTAVATLSEAGTLSAVVVTQTSDERKKRSWQHLPKDFIAQLAGIKKSGLFVWRRGGATGIGVGAQSLERILPVAVHTDERGAKTVNYGAAAMVSAVELARAHVAFEKRLAALEAK